MSLSLSTKWTENTYIKENWLFQLYNQDSYLSLDGTNDYVDLGTTTSSSSIAVTSSTGITIAFWINFPTAGESEPIFRSHDHATNYVGYGITKRTDDKIQIDWYDGSGSSSGDRRTMYGDTVLSINTWYFVVITSTFAQATSGTKIYVNSADTSDSISDGGGTASITTPNYSGSSLKGIIGQKLPSTDLWGEFKLKNLAIWGARLDATNTDPIGAIYNSGSFLSLAEDSGNYTQASDLKGYWEFNNGNNKAIDLTDNTSPATISGAKYGGFLGLSFYDTAVESIDYFGAILNKPSIRESINLESSTAKTSNVSLSLANFRYLDDDLSAELFGGDRNYINRPVKVYIQPNDDVDMGDCLQIYNGRLTDVSHNASKLSLSISAVMPWDNISIPSDKTTNSKSLVPIVYGNYTAETSTNSSPQFCDGAKVFPLEVDRVMNDEFICVAHQTVSSNGRLHIYEKNATKNGVPIFVPLDDAQNSSVVFDGKTGLKTDFDLHRSSKINAIDIHSSGDYDKFDDNGLESVDGNSATYSQLTEADFGTTSGSGTTVRGDDLDFYYDIPQFTHEMQSVKVGVFVQYSATVIFVGTGTNTVNFSIYDNTNGFTAIRSEQLQYAYNGGIASGASISFSGTSTQSGGTISGTNANPTLTITNSSITEYTSVDRVGGINGQLPDKLQIRIGCTAQQTDGSGVVTSMDIDVRLAGVYIIPEIKIPTNSDDKASIANETIDKVKYLYSGTDGLTDNGWNSSGAITEIHEAHRDLLHRHTSYTKSNTPTNWSSGTNLNGSKDWDIRYWLLESTPLIKVLEKLQFEGGFIGRFNGQGDYVYIYLPDSPSAEHTLTKDDIEDIDISMTPLSSLISKMEIEYEKHPAESKYLSSATSTNSTTRAKYNIKSAENIKSVKLDANVSAPSTTSGSASNKNDDFYRYYDWILGSPKIIVSGTIVNPIYMGVDVGDILGFSDMQVDPFGEAWSGKTFMVTSTQRTPGKLKFTAREI